MKTRIVVAAMALVTAGVMPAVAHAGGLQIPYVAPKQGQVTIVTNEEATDGTLTVGGKTSPLTQKLSETYTTELVVVNGDTVTKEKLSVSAAHNTAEAMGNKHDLDLPVKGKSYVIASDDGVKTTVTGDDGKEVAGAERDLVVKLADHVGTPDKLGQMLAKKTFTKGKKVTMSADEVDAMMGGKNEGMTASDVSLTLTGQDAKTATFAMAGTLAGKQSGMDVSVTFKGSVKVDLKTSAPIEFTMTGAMTGGGDAGGQKIGLKGTISAHKSMTYK